MIQNIIGLNGRLHSGKDTAFEAIRRHYAEVGLVAGRAAFADPLKLSAARALGFDPSSREEAVAICDDLKENGHIHIQGVRSITGREYLQLYGTEAHRDVFGTDFWVDAALPASFWDLDDLYPGVDVLVVTDVRFPNEAGRILEHHGQVWWIDADERLGALSDDAHVSERPLDPALVTAVIKNNGAWLDYQQELARALVGL